MKSLFYICMLSIINVQDLMLYLCIHKHAPIENFLNSLCSFLLLCIVTYSSKDKLIKDKVLRQKLRLFVCCTTHSHCGGLRMFKFQEMFPAQLSLNFEWQLYF